ncbi:ankyrin repeat domain-containing protein 27 isoform X1 [Stegostoma tigrinum]|uniref:ankyrin repeat domain-containing protein 27 isoform X1 n=2 Tax=Stegostoma tigrinum TaxID=3053191 RepID=UPI00202AE65B|nr:ankyrin repeat domain-containing protein 27 isoform X1 [Stegostoma tigrinum]XP_048403075.1 ankyrin repeat domain-containing protein 27 isoform X1 [Stegostoma tigrinum]XP_048403076.1 ankyrin repeat domain-containing protein 27 isoform X1 [Stegostoma tigrinum]
MSMAVYDEDISRNPFYLALQKQKPNVFNHVAELHGIVLVPCRGTLSQGSLAAAHFESYILQPVDDTGLSYRTLSGKEVTIRGNLVSLGVGFSSPCAIRILFEETFYTEKEQSFSILCIARPLEKGSSADENPSPVDTYCLKNFEDAKEFLGRQLSKVDKYIESFRMSFKELEMKSLRHHIDEVNALYTKCLQYLLRDSRLKILIKQEVQMALLKQAVEMYVLHGIHDQIFKSVGTIEASQDAAFNKTTRGLQDLQLKDLGIQSQFSINIPRAKRELSQLNQCTSPQLKLICLRNVIHAIMQSPSHRVSLHSMSADDLLPVLLYLLVKTEIPNWMANLSYIKNFRFCSAVKDELGYCLTSFEAAVEYIHQGNLTLGQPGSGDLNDKAFFRERMNLLSHLSATPIDFLFEHIAAGNQAEVEALLSQGEADEDSVEKMCHPLCFCDSCEKLVSGRLNDPSIVTPCSRDDRGYTPLHVAAFCGQASLIDLLVEKGSTVNATDYHGSTPLHLCCQKGYQNVTLLLLDYKASTEAQDNNGNTPLHLACMHGHEDCVKALVYYHLNTCKLNMTNDKGDTPLHIAARWGYDGIIQVLLENGASNEIQNKMKETPLQCALNSKILDLLELTYFDNDRRHSMPESVDRSTQPSTDAGSQKSFLSTVSSLSVETKAEEEKGKYKEVEKLLRAVADGDIEMVRYLLEWMDEDPEEEEGLVLKSEFCHPLCQCPKCEPAQKKLSSITINGLSVNSANQDGFTPLHVAALHGHFDLVSLLLRHGANVNMKNCHNATPLHLACQHNALQIVQYLLNYNAKLNKKDLYGNTSLLNACLQGHLEIAELLLEHGAYVNVANNQGNTALHEAVKGKHGALVNLLLCNGALVNLRNKQQCTPVDCAEEVCGKNVEILKILETVSAQVTDEDDVFRLNTTQTSTSADIIKKPDAFVTKPDAIDEPTDKRIQFVQSIHKFNRSENLKKTVTRDKSSPEFDELLIHQLAIKTFDKRKLKQTETKDHSARSFFNYAVDLETEKEELIAANHTETNYQGNRDTDFINCLPNKLNDVNGNTEFVGMCGQLCNHSQDTPDFETV